MLSIPELYELFRQYPAVCTDTRQLTPGCLFFALKGDHFDGNRFAAKALEAGAAYSIVDDPACVAGERCLLVADVLTALQQLANHHRWRFDIPVIAIGGSNGKTTTKELVAAVLSSHYPCHFTKGNFNNHIGVPLTLLAMPADTEVAVIEMGTNQPGDIEQLCRIAEPTHGLLTNIGKEHLEGFGDLTGVKKAEGELYRYLARHDGWIFVNLSEKYLPAMTRRYARTIGYIRAAALEARDDEDIIAVMPTGVAPFVSAAFIADHSGEVIEIDTQLVGHHNFNNVMTAIALGIYFKVPPGRIKSALESYWPSNNRSQLVRRDSNTILLDAYNANPSSVRPALESLRAMAGDKKIAILGDMLELGADSLREHEAIMRFAARMKPDMLVLVGPEFGRTGYAKFKALHFPDTAAAKKWFDSRHFEDCTFLIKGSRGMRLEQLLA
ncbi:MAG: UDP-N-acetylmuramoyl-tripeptide--D-alanyl-D-alanine ligase [Saprospiraceae bacterium]|nr:UDP-N-acetylmuramoyl-tripeptide--D-alanyl-D-alanine ligase [Saprospiraceae bacterium]